MELILNSINIPLEGPKNTNSSISVNSYARDNSRANVYTHRTQIVDRSG